MKEKILSLIRTGEPTNIELALTLMESQKLQLREVKNCSKLFEWLQTSSASMVVRDDNYNEQIQDIDLKNRLEFVFNTKDIFFGKFDFVHSIPKDLIASMTHVESITIYKQVLESIPENIGDLQNIKRLVFSNNAIKHIPDSIGKLQQLETLDLSGNFIDQLPKSISYLANLKELKLGRNAFKDIRAQKKQLKKILPNCKISI